MHISSSISATFAWSSKLMVDVNSMWPSLQRVGGRFSNFLLGKVSLEFKLHGMLIFHDIQMATYFGTGWSYSHMVGYAGSPTYTVYVDMTLTRAKVKVKVTGLLNFRKLARPCMLAAVTVSLLAGLSGYISLFTIINGSTETQNKLKLEALGQCIPPLRASDVMTP